MNGRLTHFSARILTVPCLYTSLGEHKLTGLICASVKHMSSYFTHHVLLVTTGQCVSRLHRLPSATLAAPPKSRLDMLAPTIQCVQDQNDLICCVRNVFSSDIAVTSHNAAAQHSMALTSSHFLFRDVGGGRGGGAISVPS